MADIRDALLTDLWATEASAKPQCKDFLWLTAFSTVETQAVRADIFKICFAISFLYGGEPQEPCTAAIVSPSLTLRSGSQNVF